MTARARTLAFIALAGLVVRVAYALVFADRTDPVPASDRYFFVEGARLLADGQGFLHPFVSAVGIQDAASAAHPPLWIFVLTPLAKLGLLTPMTARLAACVLGALAVLLIGLIARRVGGATAGVAAALVAAVYPAWVVTDAAGMSEPLYLVLVAAVVLALLRIGRRGSLRAGAGLGLLVGLAALARTEGLLLLVFVVAPVLWRQWRVVAVAALAAAVTIAPWTLRNAVTLDRFVPISTNVDSVLAGANCDETYAGRDIGLWSVDCFAAATDTGGGSLVYDEGRLARGWRSSGREYAMDHAERLPVVAMARVARLWRMWQPLREADTIEGVGRSSGKVGALSFLIVLLPLGLLGLVTRRLQRPHLLAFAGLALMVTVTAALGWGAPRFLRPAELGLVVGAGILLAGVVEQLVGRAAHRGPTGGAATWGSRTGWR